MLDFLEGNNNAENEYKCIADAVNDFMENFESIFQHLCQKKEGNSFVFFEQEFKLPSFAAKPEKENFTESLNILVSAETYMSAILALKGHLAGAEKSFKNSKHYVPYLTELVNCLDRTKNLEFSATVLNLYKNIIYFLCEKINSNRIYEKEVANFILSKLKQNYWNSYTQLEEKSVQI
jgi:hypothetical protein